MEDPIITEEDFDIDFDDDLETGRYQVWLIDEGSEFEVMLNEFSKVDDAKDLVDLIDSGTVRDYAEIPCWIGVVVVQIESVVDLDDCDTNIGTIYKRNIIL